MARVTSADRKRHFVEATIKVISEEGVALEKLLNNVSGRIRGGCWTLGSQAYHFAGGGKGLRGSGMGHWWRPS